MRMWMLPVQGMCRKHLMGEHVEMHMFAGSILKDISMKGYLANGLFQPEDLRKRHDDLVAEMLRRGYNHKSPMQDYEPQLFCSLTGEEFSAKVDLIHNYNDLTTRCSDCAVKMYPFIKQILAMDKEYPDNNPVNRE